MRISPSPVPLPTAFVSGLINFPPNTFQPKDVHTHIHTHIHTVHQMPPGLKQWFSTTGNFVPRGHLIVSGDIIGVTRRWGGQCCWNLISRNQGYCSTFDNAQDTSSPPRIIWSQISRVLRLRSPGLYSLGLEARCQQYSYFPRFFVFIFNVIQHLKKKKPMVEIWSFPCLRNFPHPSQGPV